jgi:hypothetical protein
MQKEDTHNFYIDLKLPQETRLHFSNDYDSVSAWRLLSRYISRYPQDLRVHTQRILLSIDHQLQELPGALQDLSIALSGKGQPFFNQLLELAKSSLSDEKYTQLKQSAENDINDQNQCWNKGSVLASGVCGGKKIVTFTGTEEVYGFDSVLDEARAYIEYGQIEEAQLVLEEELLANPVSEGIEDELLYLYQSTRQQDHLEMMTNKLLGLGIELSPEWQQSIDDAKSW